MKKTLYLASVEIDTGYGYDIMVCFNKAVAIREAKFDKNYSTTKRERIGRRWWVQGWKVECPKNKPADEVYRDWLAEQSCLPDAEINIEIK